MKKQWKQFAARLDALSQRERLMVFLGSAALLVFLAESLVIGPMLQRQEALHAQLVQQLYETAAANEEIANRLQQAAVDPDAPVRVRLGATRSEYAQVTDALRTMQQGMVAPERMAGLLESILRANGRLKMVSVRTLASEPVSAIGAQKNRTGSSDEAIAADIIASASGTTSVLPSMAASAASAAGAAGAVKPDAATPDTATPAAARPAERELLFRHGVEIGVRGSYLDMIDYMAALQALPTQVLWGKAELEVEDYPNARLTLTLYTLSLDEKWMKL